MHTFVEYVCNVFLGDPVEANMCKQSNQLISFFFSELQLLMKLSVSSSVEFATAR